ncbi:PREDICTED: TMV resistance protein N-like isoform X1 [Nicotiana attenuata]|uniref:Tmv resistance protein n n=2 Tax=Nicotiana attenuata TaxID=49451 RepID=A0A314KHT6_NICAT|nr:PREDICTED: TMV resistance protein N-like isoform X1 [Nicotiana attenuata]OIT28454.1 tmv resistance protein n [Nicotiana attenuata]
MATEQGYEQSIPKASYEVFLSFKSEDTGKNFTDHLSTALNQAGFRTFKGGDDESRSTEEEDSSSDFAKAIQESKISIIVFSQNYASSSWCLDQLVTILERKMKFACTTILPIFYHVDPSNLRKHKGSFGEALNRHEEKFKSELRHGNEEEWEDKLKKWKDALSQAADLAGMVLENQHESHFIKKIINVISTRLSRPALYIASCTIGIHRRARSINSWVQHESNTDIGILLVCGIGGIGKTTLAKFVYNLNFGYFECSCFLANIRETSKLPNGVITLQKQLLSTLLKHEKVNISSVDEGIIKIRNALCYRKILLILDDVDEPDLVEAIFDIKDWFGFGSKIIVTTRHKNLLRPQLGHDVHEVEILYTTEATELFNWHAFGENNASEGYYKEYSEEVIEWCRGLPLAIQVIGSSLAGKSKDVWRSAIEKLRDIPTNKIVDKLRLSYELLDDDHDQNLFLHLCCFFEGMKKDFVVRILDKCDFYTLVGIQNLIDRSLVTIGYVNEITMHQLVRDMGRDIVRREAPVEPGKRSRLWHHTDSYNVLRGKTGTEAVQGMVLDMRMIKKVKYSSPLIPVRQNAIGFFTWSTKGNSSSENVRTDAFEKMHKLRFIQFNKVQVDGSFKNFPKGLRWLCWSGFPEECIPNEFPMGSVVSIDMQYSSLKQLWKGFKFLPFLEILDLGHSYDLITTPDFSGLSNLERLILEHCTKLIHVHETIGCLQKLVILNLKDCQKLKSLPDSICELKCLETLNISGCSNIEYLPTELDKLTSLKELYADGISMNRVAISTELGSQTWYSSLYSWALKGRVISPSKIQEIHFPRSLHVLNIAKCNLCPDAFNKVDLGIMSLLDWLDLGGNPICNLPDSIKNLTRLKTLNIAYCTKIKYLDGLPSNISDLNADGCISLKKVAASCAKGHPVEGYLNCINLVEAEGVFKLEPLENADAQVLANMGISTLEPIKSSIKVSLVFGRAYNAGRVRNEYPSCVQDDIASLFSLEPKKFPPQILYHRGVFSTFLPGESVPNWFSYKFTDAADVYCTLPNVDSHRVISGLSICFVYTCPEAYTNVGLYDGPAIWVRNQTKDLNWALYPAWFGLPEDEISGMMWFSYWKVETLFQQGDVIEVMVSPQFAAFKELGVKIFYLDEQTENISDHSNVCKSSSPFEDILRNHFSDEERTYYICT